MKISTNIALMLVLVLSGCTHTPLPDTHDPLLETPVEDNQEQELGEREPANEGIIEPETVTEESGLDPTPKPDPIAQQNDEVAKTQAAYDQREEPAEPTPQPEKTSVAPKPKAEPLIENPKPNPTPKPEPVVKESCHPSYSGCLKADASDYDCAQGSGNGPYYTGKVEVLGPDVFDLDRDNDGWGCE